MNFNPILNNLVNNMQLQAETMPARRINPGSKIYNYPYISSLDFKKTLENYEAFVQQYKNKIEDLNADVKSYNKLVDAMIKAKKADKLNCKFEAELFSKDHNALFTQDFNDLVEKENKKKDVPTLKKRKFQPVRWNSKLFFKAILGFYSSQIKRNNLKLLQTNRNTARPLEKVVLNSHRLANSTNDDNTILNDAHKKSFQRHIKRFREAGILVDYQFINSNKPVLCNINSDILVISDHKKEKTQTTEKQFFILERGTKCTDDNHTTRTFLNKIEMKGDKSPIKGSSHTLTSSDLLLQEHQENKNLTKVKPEAAAQILTDPISSSLEATILDNTYFAKMLHKNLFVNYEPITKDVFYHEAHKGQLNKGQFRTIVIQDTVKKLSVLWKNSNFHVGSWINALKIIDDTWFKTFNGLDFDKETIYNRLEEYEFRVKKAIAWFNKNKSFNILYPSEYFNPKRKHSFECGFQFTAQWWSSYQSDKKQAPQQRKKADAEAKRRKKYNNFKKRMQTKVRKVVAKEITLLELYNYLDTNGFPEEIIDMVPKTIEYYQNI